MNISLFKTIIATFIFSSIIFSQNNLEVNSVNTAEEYIKHADTYYLLSRARDNEITDIDKAVQYFDKAKIELKKFKKSPENVKIDQKIQKGLNILRVQKEDAVSEIKNFTPLFSILLNQNKSII